MTIREEQAHDCDAIRRINNAAFGAAPEVTTVEARLVDQLRADGDVILSLVAALDDKPATLVGHILFSKLSIRLTNGVELRGAALAPMAVWPAQQRRGIGSALVREGLVRCGAMGVEVVCVVGHRDYYPRFGFSTTLGRSIRSPYAGDAFMALELVPGALPSQGCEATYARAFSEL